MKSVLNSRYRRYWVRLRQERKQLLRLLDEGEWLSPADDPRAKSRTLVAYMDPRPEQRETVLHLLDYADGVATGSESGYLMELIRDVSKKGSLPLQTWTKFIEYAHYEHGEDLNTDAYISRIHPWLFSASLLQRLHGQAEFPMQLRACISPLFFPRIWHQHFFPRASVICDQVPHHKTCILLSRRIQSFVRAPISAKDEFKSAIETFKLVKGIQIKPYDTHLRSSAELRIRGATYVTFEAMRKFSSQKLFSRYPWDYWTSWFGGDHYLIVIVLSEAKVSRRISFGIMNPLVRGYEIVESYDLFDGRGRIEFALNILKSLSIFKGLTFSSRDCRRKQFLNGEFSFPTPRSNIRILPVVSNKVLLLETCWTCHDFASFCTIRKTLRKAFHAICTIPITIRSTEFYTLSEPVSRPYRWKAIRWNYSIQGCFRPCGAPLLLLKSFQIEIVIIPIIELLEIHWRYGITFHLIPWDAIFISIIGKIFIVDYSLSKYSSQLAISLKSERSKTTNLTRCIGSLLLDERVTRHSRLNFKTLGKYLRDRSFEIDARWIIQEIFA